MRDGNATAADIVTDTMSFSLPMRDGNELAAANISAASVLAYL